MSSEELSTNEAINEFYRMKSKYEDDVYSKYISPLINNKTMSKKEKRQEYLKMPKPQCINCKRNVGTIFLVSEDKETLFRVFTAKCGDIVQPCPLNIVINYSIREQIDHTIEQNMKEINKIKLDIIKEKNNLLFFSNDLTSETTMNTFNVLTDKLKDLTSVTGYFIEKNILMNDNPVKRDLLKKTIDEFGKEMLLPFKNLISEFNEKGNEQIVTEALRFYKEEMMPKLNEILNLKYDINMVEYEDITKEYKLVQLHHSLQNNENFYQEDDKVVSFIKGVKKSKSATMKVKEIITLSDQSRINKKTRKVKPTTVLEFNIEEDQEQDQEQDQDKGVYIDIYNKLPSNLKEELNKYPDWLNDFIDNCIQSRKNNKSCDFTAPKNLILPPKQIENTQMYDFGYEPFNNVFNDMSNDSKEMYFKLIKIDENGNKDYITFKNALTNLVSKRLGFQKIAL
jgi:hypothetical protein